MIYHFSSRIDLGGLFFHGYLAVDFFFCLSGYVLHRAYAGRLRSREIGIRVFVVIRLIRLMPLVLVGNLIAAIVDIFRPGDFSLARHLQDVAIVLVMSSVLLPTFWKTTLEDTTYPLNGPVWSLFFEFVANLVYAFVLRFDGWRDTMAILALGSFSALVVAAFAKGDIHFGPHYEFFVLAFPRVFFSFFVGVLLATLKIRLPRFSRWIHAGVLAGVVIVPEISDPYLSGLYDIAAIALVFPALVLGAAHCRNGEGDARLSSLAGDISYPIYCIHYPLVRALAAVTRQLNLGAGGNLAVSLLGTLALAVAAWFAFKLYDKPVRRRLNRLLAERLR